MIDAATAERIAREFVRPHDDLHLIDEDGHAVRKVAGETTWQIEFRLVIPAPDAVSASLAKAIAAAAQKERVLYGVARIPWSASEAAANAEIASVVRLLLHRASGKWPHVFLGETIDVNGQTYHVTRVDNDRHEVTVMEASAFARTFGR